MRPYTVLYTLNNSTANVIFLFSHDEFESLQKFFNLSCMPSVLHNSFCCYTFKNYLIMLIPPMRQISIYYKLF